MRRSVALVLGVLAGLLGGAALVRRRTSHRERADLYFEDGSMLSLMSGSPGADRLLPMARDVLRITQG